MPKNAFSTPLQELLVLPDPLAGGEGACSLDFRPFKPQSTAPNSNFWLRLCAQWQWAKTSQTKHSKLSGLRH